MLKSEGAIVCVQHHFLPIRQSLCKWHATTHSVMFLNNFFLFSLSSDGAL